jgi:hypothetical protein
MRGLDRAAVLLALCAFTASCGYALAGRGNTLPGYVKTIGVPPIVNHSTTPDIDRILTSALQAEFQSRGRYRVVPDAAGASLDAVLTATITSVDTPPVAFDPKTNQATSRAIVLVMNVEFKDLHENKVLWSNPAFRFSDEYPQTTSTTATAEALFTQDANAADRISKRFAREVVTSILEAF